MRVLSIFLLTLLSFSYSFGFMVWNDNSQKEIRILKELDIEPKYVNNEYFLLLKNNRMNTTKQEFINTITKEYKHAAIIKDVLKSEMLQIFYYI